MEIEDVFTKPRPGSVTACSMVVNPNNTLVIECDVVKVTAWYDNEWGFSCRCAEAMGRAGKL